MKQKTILTLITIFLLTNWIGASISATPVQPAWTRKVGPEVLSKVQNGETEYLIILRDQADLSPAEDMKTKLEKGTFVYERLTEVADASQGSLIAILDGVGATYQAFWVTNMIWVRGDVETLQRMAIREEVAKIEANPTIQLSIPDTAPPDPQPQAVSGIEWNLTQINAPQLWALGFTGEGIVIGGQDTGYDWDHEALIGKYRGWDGSSADHNYNWHDTVTSGGGSCGPNTTEPCDDHGHGTHTMGTMVGDDGGTNQIGVAPDAQWIGCRNMNVGDGTPASYIECYQWFIAPTDLNNENPDPAKAPHVINNSWSCPVTEGCSDPNILLSVVQAARAAGIVTVHSAGNQGPNCSTVSEPAGTYAESFSVGATDANDNIVSFSSRGPVNVDSSNRLKPNITAPGYNIRSSKPGDVYGTSSGTSMAAPHVAGLVALLLSANPKLIGQVDQIEDLIESTAMPRTSTQTCGEVQGSEIPNNTYGYGRVDAWDALNATLDIFFYPLIFP
jgi:subtilisin family serine protease